MLGSEATKMFTAEMSTEIANKVQSSIIDFLNKKLKYPYMYRVGIMYQYGK